MKHLGDITKLNGSEIPAVDCIIGGSPCQDLSVAGKRTGLSGERSELFMDQVRIVKEMREHDRQNGRTGEFIRPRYMVWENVPGAFSSNKGEDFRIVLEETARVSNSDAVIPRPPGRWSNAGVILGDDWSIAWRVHDAQFWGVPQRRKRIALVADFGGQSAPEILFERKSVPGDIEESGKEREEVAGSITESTGEAISFQERSGKSGLNTGGGGQRQPCILQQDIHTLSTSKATYHCVANVNKAGALVATDYKDPPTILRGGCNTTNVRRLTPLECERLQGFPDGWTDIGEWTDTNGKIHKESSDSARYKALGNSIALPFWRWLLKRISNQYDRVATMGSLFDGIGGFPLCWEECNGKGSAIWASEIEEFPIAVTKKHFPEN